MEGQLLNRKTFKAIKKFDRQEMDNFFKNNYEHGFKDGFRSGTESGQQVDFKIELVQVLQATKGIGDKTIKKVLETLKNREDFKEAIEKLGVK